MRVSLIQQFCINLFQIKYMDNCQYKGKYFTFNIYIFENI